MQTPGHSRREIGQLLMTPVYASFADNISMRTVDGGRLVFRSDRAHDPADGPPEVAADCLAAVSPIRRYGNDDPNTFALTTAVTDDAGHLWQRTRAINIYEIWRNMLAGREFYQFADLASDCHPDNLKSVTRRVLLEPEETLCDTRERHLVEVIRKGKQSCGQPAETERLMFRLRFKYFGAAIGLIEERCVFSTTSSQPWTKDELVITVQPHHDPKSIVVVHGGDDEVVFPPPPTKLAELGTLCVRNARFSAGWEMPANDLPCASDPALWREKYRELGVAPESIRAFKANPAIHYEPS